MSKATKRKHVTKEVLDDFILPSEKQQIVRVSPLDPVGGRSDRDAVVQSS